MRPLCKLLGRPRRVHFRQPEAFVRHLSRFPPVILPTKPLPHQNKPVSWLDDRFQNEHWLSDDHALMFDPTVETLHQLIRENKFTTAHRVRCRLQDQGKDIPHDMLFLDAALGEINTLSPATYHAFYGWLNLIPAKHIIKTSERNPFRLFGSLYRSGKPSQDLEAIFGMVKIASSKGYFFEVFERVFPLMVRLVKPSSGLDLMLEFEKGYLDYIIALEPQNAKRHASLARETLILELCKGKGRWIKMAVKLLKRSKQKGISVSSEVSELVKTLAHNEKAG
ncbi:hypothetical protein HHX47_DHR2000773 [Lentinula edodes]|nr:hypothetical protein HHX47_DHR2000773 [Lentinula edodes]